MWPEGKYATLSSEALWIHHIQARRLYGQIQGALYGPARTQKGETDAVVQEVISGYMQQVQQWYMKSRFNSTVIPFSEESIKRHVSILSNCQSSANQRRFLTTFNTIRWSWLSTNLRC
jgi:hypothetical protein